MTSFQQLLVLMYRSYRASPPREGGRGRCAIGSKRMSGQGPASSYQIDASSTQASGIPPTIEGLGSTPVLFWAYLQGQMNAWAPRRPSSPTCRLNWQLPL